MKNLNKQKGYYGPDLSGLGTLLLIICGFGLFGLWKVGELIYWVCSNISFGG